MGAGYVGILTFELHFPEAGSLKGKRRFVRSAKAQLQNRLGASVAEVDHHDLWQRARLTIACVAREAREAERLLDEAERYLVGQEWDASRYARPRDDLPRSRGGLVGCGDGTLAAAADSRHTSRRLV